MVFTIQSFDNSDEFLSIKHVEQTNFGEMEEWNENRILEIIKVRQNGPEKMIKWTMKPFISDSDRSPSKGEVVYWMSTEYRDSVVEPSKLYLDDSLEAATNSRSPWVFDCVE